MCNPLLLLHMWMYVAFLFFFRFIYLLCLQFVIFYMFFRVCNLYCYFCISTSRQYYFLVSRACALHILSTFVIIFFSSAFMMQTCSWGPLSADSELWSFIVIFYSGLWLFVCLLGYVTSCYLCVTCCFHYNIFFRVYDPCCCMVNFEFCGM